MPDVKATKMLRITRAKASRLMDSLKADHPRVGLMPIELGPSKRLREWIVLFDGVECGRVKPGALTRDAVLKLVPEHERMGERTYSTVDARYKALYAEVSDNGRNCGDWLASFINSQCLTEDEKGPLDVDRFARLLQNNGIDLSTPKWASAYRLNSGSRGWQGRFRMSGRVVLERVIATTSRVFGADGKPYAIPPEELARIQARHSAARH